MARAEAPVGLWEEGGKLAGRSPALARGTATPQPRAVRWTPRLETLAGHSQTLWAQ